MQKSCISDQQRANVRLISPDFVLVAVSVLKIVLRITELPSHLSRKIFYPFPHMRVFVVLSRNILKNSLCLGQCMNGRRIRVMKPEQNGSLKLPSGCQFLRND
jgi:hypothetical protein